MANPICAGEDLGYEGPVACRLVGMDLAVLSSKARAGEDLRCEGPVACLLVGMDLAVRSSKADTSLVYLFSDWPVTVGGSSRAGLFRSLDDEREARAARLSHMRVACCCCCCAYGGGGFGGLLACLLACACTHLS